MGVNSSRNQRIESFQREIKVHFHLSWKASTASVRKIVLDLGFLGVLCGLSDRRERA